MIRGRYAFLCIGIIKTMILQKKIYPKTNKSIKWTDRNGRRIR